MESDISTSSETGDSTGSLEEMFLQGKKRKETGTATMRANMRERPKKFEGDTGGGQKGQKRLLNGGRECGRARRGGAGGTHGEAGRSESGEGKGLDLPATIEDVRGRVCRHTGAQSEGTQSTDGFPQWRPANFSSQEKWYQSDKTNVEVLPAIEEAYEEVLTWKRNLFCCPSGKIGKEVVQLVREGIEWWTQKSGKEALAWKAVLVMLPLIFQKPEGIKAPEIKELVKKRIQWWRNGEITKLLEEARYLQKHRVAKWSTAEPEHVSKSFARRVALGKVKGAVDLLNSQKKGGGIVCSDEMKTKLREKHPKGSALVESACLGGEFMQVPACIFEKMDEEMIRKIALSGRGAAGPSGLDSDDWRILLAAKGFGGEGQKLCGAVAETAKRLCREFVDPDAIEALLRGREVPLPKGVDDVRPIGIGEPLRRIIGKAVMKVVGDDVQEACGATQVCAGLEAGCEAAIHVTREMYLDPDCEAALLVDAKNAFNCLNRKVALHNIGRLCPSFFPFLVNSYRRPVRLHVTGCEETMLSEEGTTQGDPCGMAMYAIGIVPLIAEEDKYQTDKESLGEKRDVRQVWYADDATGLGKLEGLRKWWDRLVERGRAFGYFVNEGKTVLVVKKSWEQKAKDLFRGSGIKITVEGNRHLGAAVGTDCFLEEYVCEKAKKLGREIEALADIAQHEPQAAYTAYVAVVKHKWIFLQRTIPCNGDWYAEIEEKLRNHLLPKLIGKVPDDVERRVLAMPVRDGGMGLPSPRESASENFQMSQQITKALQNEIRNQNTHLQHWDREFVRHTKREEIKKKREREKSAKAVLLEDIRCVSGEPATNAKEKEKRDRCLKDGYLTLIRAVEVASEKGASSWLTHLPLAKYGFTLSKRDFHDAVAVRYGWLPPDVGKKCLCGKANSVGHATSCKMGGFPIMVHNEVRDVVAGFLVDAGCKDVRTEDRFREVEHRMDGGEKVAGEILGEEARMDVTALGLWGRLQRAYLDVRVTNPTAPSNLRKSLDTLKKANEKEKKKAYGRRVREVEGGSFTPMVFTTMGGCGKECAKVLQRVGQMIAMRTREEESVVMAGLRAKIGYALIRGAILGLRGHRKWKKGLWEEGQELGLMKEEIRMRD